MKAIPYILLLSIIAITSCKKDKTTPDEDTSQKLKRLTKIYHRVTINSGQTLTNSKTTTLKYDNQGYLVEYAWIDSAYNSITYPYSISFDIHYNKITFERDKNHKVIKLTDSSGGSGIFDDITYDSNGMLSKLKSYYKKIYYTYENEKLIKIFDSAMHSSYKTATYTMTYDSDKLTSLKTAVQYSGYRGTIPPPIITEYTGLSYNEQQAHLNVVKGIECYYPFYDTEPQFLSGVNMTGYSFKSMSYQLYYDENGYLQQKVSTDSTEHNYYTYEDL